MDIGVYYVESPASCFAHFHQLIHRAGCGLSCWRHCENGPQLLIN